MTIAKKTETDIWFKGYGPDHYVCQYTFSAVTKGRLFRSYTCLDHATKGPSAFFGGTYTVETYQDLERASKIPGATEIIRLTDAPGGGSFVTVKDPEGFPVNLVYGQEPTAGDEPPAKLVANYEKEKPRLREFLRFQPGPAGVHKVCGQPSSKQNLLAG
jgi:hypothetical protein